MKHLKTPQELNEATENLNISDVMNSILKELEILKEESEDKMDKFKLDGSDLSSSYYLELGKSRCLTKVKEIISKYYS
jgi:hypothetical protein